MSVTRSCDSQSECSIIHGSVPGYSGSDKLYFLANDSGTNLPPRKWNLPWKCFAQSFGAVREIKKSGWIPFGFPSSTCHPDDLSDNKTIITSKSSFRYFFFKYGCSCWIYGIMQLFFLIRIKFFCCQWLKHFVRMFRLKYYNLWHPF